MELGQIRREIDRIDAQMKTLFLQRIQASAQVIEAKKQTGAAVYAPKREQEVLALRSFGVEEECRPECLAFFRRMMEIGRVYQYSKLVQENEKLSGLPAGEGRVELSCSYPSKQELLSVFLNAASLAGLTAEEVSAKREGETMKVRIVLAGDFSLEAAKAAVLQIMEEAEKVDIFML